MPREKKASSAERSGFMPTGYEYREYKNWRGIAKPRRCPFCKQAKGEIRKTDLTKGSDLNIQHTIFNVLIVQTRPLYPLP